MTNSRWYGGGSSVSSRLPVPDVLELVNQVEGETGFSYYAPSSSKPVHPIVLPRESYADLFRGAVALLGLLRRALLETARQQQAGSPRWTPIR